MDSAEDYNVLSKIGQGAHGTVLKALHIPSGTVVALKKIPLGKIEDGIPIGIVREIKALQHLRHENIIKLHAYIPQRSTLQLVFDYTPTDLSAYLTSLYHPLQLSHIKCIFQQVLRGVAYCHTHHIMHRDLKPANLLLTAGGVIKLADFGLARPFGTKTRKEPISLNTEAESEGRVYSHRVATRWYRAPELLYGSRTYDHTVDLWSLGCIFYELLTLTPLFPGSNDIDQLYRVLSTLGTPTDATWPSLKSLPDYEKISFPTFKGKQWHEIAPDVDVGARELLSKFLKYEGRERIEANDVLVDNWLYMEPIACRPEELGINGSTKLSRKVKEWDVDGEINLFGEDNEIYVA
ncbi:kinase-like domain-containing protein [Gaertneriomyces semiglobifer]|nr:kinase-like domain-containing protein [Gaertneriomyces semiglobifer]